MPARRHPSTDTAAATDMGASACPVAAAAIAVWNECTTAASQSTTSADQPPSSQATTALARPPPGIEAPRLDEAAASVAGDLAAVGLGSTDFDKKLPVPTLVAVGQRNAGKSALLEALVGIALFPRGTPTRAAVRVVLRRGPMVDPYMRVAPIGTAPAILPDATSARAAASSFPWRRVPAAILTQHDRLPDVVRHVMDRLVPAAADATHHFATDREIQLVVQTPTAAPLHLLDLPGLIGEGNPGHTAVKALLKSTLNRVKATARVLWVHSATERSANSSVGALLRERGVMNRTTGVLTNCDRVRNDDPDVADVTGIAALLRDDAASHSRAVGGGWYAVANAKVPDESPNARLCNMPQREAATLKRLTTVEPSDMSDAELVDFDADVALVSEKWGMGRVRDEVQAAYDAFVAEHWDPHMRRCILRRLEEAHMRLGSLGVPFTVPTDPEKDGAVDADFEEVRRFVSARAEELPLAATLMASARNAAGDLAVAIKERFDECVQNYNLAAAGDGALARASRDLEEAMGRLAKTEERTYSGVRAQHSALHDAKALTAELEAATAKYQTTVRKFIEDDGDAGLVGSFLRFVRRPDGPKTMSPNGGGGADEGHTLVLHLHRFEGVLACFERLLRKCLRQIEMPALTAPSPRADTVFKLHGRVVAGGPVTVRCAVDSATLVEHAEAWHWRAAAAVSDALCSAPMDLACVAKHAVRESEWVPAQRLALFQRCARLCGLHGSLSAAATPPDKAPCLVAALRQYNRDHPLVRLDTKQLQSCAAERRAPLLRLSTIPDGLFASSALRTMELTEFAAVAIRAGFCAGCPSLTTVRITSPQRTVRSIGARFLAECPQLEEADLSGLAGIETVGARCLAFCPKLSAVDVTVFSATVVTLGSHFLHESCHSGLPPCVRQRWPCLTNANLRGMHTRAVEDTVARGALGQQCEWNPEGFLLAAASAQVPLLTKLVVCECEVTDESIVAVAEQCPQLQHLDVRNTKGNVTDASIAAVARHCPHLKHLDVSHTNGKVTDASIEAVAQHCPQLHHLNVRSSKGKVTDASIALVAEHCPQLQHLDVSWTKGKVTDVSIEAVAQHCPQLQYLNVSETWGNVTDASIAALRRRRECTVEKT